MIAKHVPMKSTRKSDIAELINYLTSDQGKKERLGSINATNCEAATQTAITAEIIATQQQNTRAQGDKTYHLLISFRSGEKPNEETLKSIEKRICEGPGFKEHQRVSAIHYDTDNLHIHIAINKIHPTHNTLHEPYQAYRALAELCEKLEQEYGLETDNHQSRQWTSEARAADMEHHSGIESLVSWIKRSCIDEIKLSATWSELHQTMEKNGLTLRERGNGFIIEATDGTRVKASTVARELSKPKLEARLGPFETSTEQKKQKQDRRYQKRPVKTGINTVELYARYKIENQKNTGTRTVEWRKIRAQKNQQIEASKNSNRLRRATIKLIGEGRLNKKILYSQAHQSFREKTQAINKKYQQEKKAIFNQYQSLTWADWLKKKSLQGDQEALAALRSRRAARSLKGNTIKGEGLPSKQIASQSIIDNITKKGTIIYRVGGNSVRDDGDKLQVSHQINQEGLKVALQLAIERYGDRITVNGTDQFKEQIIQTAARSKIPITFADPEIERRHQILVKDKQNEQRQRREQGRRTDRGNNDHARSIGDHIEYRAGRTTNINGRINIHKPNTGRIGQNPPPQSQHRLRELSQLDMVRIANGSEMLLPSDVPGDMEQQRAHTDNPLRWGVFRSRLNPEQIKAADKYIAEREDKRQKIFDITKHIPYNGRDGVITYAGTRIIDGEALALLKQDETIMVLPINEAMARRVKRLTVGDSVTITKGGAIRRSKKRSR